MKSILLSILIAVSMIIGAILFTSNSSTDVSLDSLNKNNNDKYDTENVSIVDGKQIVEINAKGGYSPRKTLAKAGIPTIIRFNTVGTFDCSLALRIPSLNINKFLPQTGQTDIDIGVQQPSIFKGSCSMGMYFFEIKFE